MNQHAPITYSAASRQADMKLATCPCCGRPKIFDQPTVSLEMNSISFRDKTVIVTPTVASVAFVLAESMPRPVSDKYLFERVWGGLSDTVLKPTTKVHICKLRRAIEPFGDLLIETIAGAGWRMIVEGSRG